MPRKATPKDSSKPPTTDSGDTAPPSGSGVGGGEKHRDAHAQAREVHIEEAALRHGWPPWAPLYLVEIMRNGGQRGKALAIVDRGWGTLTDLRERFPSFLSAEGAALAVAKEIAEDEARRRAIEGVVTARTIMPDGRIIEKIEYSDQILLRLLERLETGSWRQKQQIEHSAPDMFPTRAARKEALAKVRAEIADEDSREGREPESPLSLPSPEASAPGTPSE